MSQTIKNKQISVISPFDINDQRLINVSLPTIDKDAANKYYVDNIFNDIYDVTGEPTGFPSDPWDDSTISISGNVISITPTGSTFYYYIKGQRYISTGATHTISDVEGSHHYYFNLDGEFHEYLSFSESLIFEHAYTATLYWDAVKKEVIYIGDERHGLIMDSVTHSYLHTTFGTQYVSGLAISLVNPVDGTGDVPGDAQIKIEDGSIADEDILLNISDDDPQNLRPILHAPVFYKDGANGYWRKEDANLFPVITGGTGRLAWNELSGGIWQQTEIGNSDFVNCHVFATNDIYYPIVAIQGQAEYTNVSSARTGANDEINSLVTAGMGFQEFTPIATVIFQSNNSYTNAVHGRIISTDDGYDFVDWRGTKVSPGVSPSSHNSLSDLHVDNHFQYALLNGRTGDVLKIDTISGFTSGVVSFDGNKITNVNTPTQNTDAANKLYVDNSINNLNYSATDINLTALSGTSGVYLATNTTVQNIPITRIKVSINSIEVNVGNGTVINADCFFSDDSGITPKSFINVAQGDELYWNGDVAKYQLESTDEIDFNYLTK